HRRGAGGRPLYRLRPLGADAARWHRVRARARSRAPRGRAVHAGGALRLPLGLRLPRARGGYGSPGAAVALSLGAPGSLLAALVVLLIGTLVNRRVGLLSKYNIPDPITG